MIENLDYSVLEHIDHDRPEVIIGHFIVLFLVLISFPTFLFFLFLIFYINAAYILRY